MNLDHDLLQEIKSRADIVDVISSYINVIKKGRRYVAVCPFHDDHNPSMDINKEKQTFHCYVCHHGGDVFTFVADYEKISFVEAVKKVCEIINFYDPRLHKNEFKQAPIDENIDKLYKCITELQKYYVYCMQIQEGEVARNYLSSRNIEPEQIEKFGLGYAPKDGRATISHLQQKGFSLKNIEDIGITLVKASGSSDSNAGRLMFPIKNHNDQVVGFSARRLVDDGSAKFVNSPETKIFKKNSLLYNLNNAKQTIKRDGFVYIVEGFMDVFALDTIGINSVVALMGTKMTQNHVAMLKKLNVEVRLCLDGDGPGQMAMMDIMKELDKAQVRYRLVSTPNELRDPDDILKQDGESALKKHVNNLVDSFSFSMNYYSNYEQLESVEDKKRIISNFATFLLNVNSKIERDNYIYKLSKVTGFEYNAIVNYLREVKKYKAQDNGEDNTFVNFGAVETKRVNKSIDKKLRRLLCAEKAVLELMSQNLYAVKYYETNIKYFANDIYRQLANFIIDYASQHKNVNVSMIIDIISSGDYANKNELINQLVSLNPPKLNDDDIKTALDEYMGIIQEERNKTYEKSQLSKACVGKSENEKAKLIDDYIKRTNKNA